MDPVTHTFPSLFAPELKLPLEGYATIAVVLRRPEAGSWCTCGCSALEFWSEAGLLLRVPDPPPPLGSPARLFWAKIAPQPK